MSTSAEVFRFDGSNQVINNSPPTSLILTGCSPALPFGGAAPVAAPIDLINQDKPTTFSKEVQIQ